MASASGSAVTVTGVIDPSELGVTLSHEHVFIDLNNWIDPPASAYEAGKATEPVSLDNLWYVHRNRNVDNYRLSDYDIAVDEISRFHSAGGRTVVDVTPKGTGSDPRMVRRVSRATGVQFVHGTAYYVQSAHPPDLTNRDREEIEEEFVSDVLEGIGDTDVRAGIVGEIGMSTDSDGELLEDELKVLRAGAAAARRTGASLSIHPPGRTESAQRDRTYPTARWALEVLDVVEDEGLPPDRVIMDHMDRSFYSDVDIQKDLAARGAYLEYDQFGADGIYFESENDGYPSDMWRINAIRELIDADYGSQLLVSQDICKKTQLTRYGGFGYGHILENGVPMLKEHGGLSDADVDDLLVNNPREILTFDEPSP